MSATRFARPGSRQAEGRVVYPGFIRWLFLWITLLALVVVVVIGFLIGIVSNLKSIDSGLHEANASVTNIGGEANPLPTFISEINGNLTKIDVALKPITGQAGSILGALNSIHGSLGNVQGSLVNTSGSLVNTANSLGDTSTTLVGASNTLGTISTTLTGASGTLTGVSGALVDVGNKLGTISGSLVDVANKVGVVRSRAGSIDTVLRQTQHGRIGSHNLPIGTVGIAPRVALINKVLGPVKVDADNIAAGLVDTNGHLNSICRSKILSPGLVPTLVAALTNLINPKGPCPTR